MSQPVSFGGRFTVVSGGVGTAVVENIGCTLTRVLIPGTYIGTINFHDASSAAGTTANSQIYSMGLPATAVPGNIEVGVRCAYGLVYQATGTPLCTIVTEK